MTSSLPKIKTLTNNSESGSQKKIKFIKMKLNTSQSEADIRERFKSVKTERSSKLQRYSTVHEQRQYKKEKIQLNLLERKLMTGTYDQATQRGNDLNSLKQKTDFYKSQAVLKQVQIEKYQKALQDLKKQAEGFTSQKVKKQKIINKIQRKYDNQKSKTDTIVFEKVSLQYMITERQNINLCLEGKINQRKLYLTKLKSIIRQTDGELRQSTENMRNLMSKVKKINNQLERQQRNREQIIQSKQVIISKRKDDEKLRQQRSIEYKKSLDEAQVQIQQKGLTDLCKSVSANLFIQKYCEITKNNLEEKYQLMQNMYNKICSYRKFDSQLPKNMVERFRILKDQTASYEANAKKLQENQAKLQKRYNQLLQKFNQSRVITKKPQSAEINQRRPSPDKFQVKQMAEMQYQKKLTKNNEDTSQIFNKIDSIGRWSQRYARELNIRAKNNFTSQEISRNILNILKVIQDEKKNIEEYKKRQDARKPSI